MEMIHVGTSGWQYRHWRDVFYPRTLSQQEWLPYFAERFQTVEVNNTFYNLPEKRVFETWARRTPRDFLLALKMSRFLTHLKRLDDPEEPVHRFMERASALGSKLGPILLQLPPGLQSDTARLEDTLAAFPPEVRVAVEFRDPSWFTEETRAILERHGAALCLADSPRRTQPAWRTADWTFVRFHEGSGLHPPGYSDEALRRWIDRLTELWTPAEDLFVYFNNDRGGHAIEDAVTFARLAQAKGFSTTRVPARAAA
ncbi:MAG TPA: DUF72 domain-containing protein [Candidatus Dormibacteraeota bacterium]|nr:DUF72 domain-containing protein [Candidatus Dormibacteraeota bacterium]